jgi:rubrerythrin
LFPETREFWDGLSREEMDHASWMEYLYKKAQSGTVLFNDEKIKTYTLESYVKYLNENLARIKERAPTLQAAFTLALSIENSLIVRRAFDHFQSSDPELTVLLTDLREKLKGHRTRIEEEARKHAAPGGKKPLPLP